MGCMDGRAGIFTGWLAASNKKRIDRLIKRVLTLKMGSTEY